MTERNKMICPDCQREMNHHADKIDYSASSTEPTTVDPDFGGIIEEVHTCAGCGKTATRQAI